MTLQIFNLLHILELTVYNKILLIVMRFKNFFKNPFNADLFRPLKLGALVIYLKDIWVEKFKPRKRLSGLLRWWNSRSRSFWVPQRTKAPLICIICANTAFAIAGNGYFFCSIVPKNTYLLTGWTMPDPSCPSPWPSFQPIFWSNLYPTLSSFNLNSL